MIRRRKSRECVGELAPERLYTLKRLNRMAGLGRVFITDGVRANVIESFPAGNRVFYQGSDVIAWIKAQKTRNK